MQTIQTKKLGCPVTGRENMRILFVTDSKAPNVALMKFSTWADMRGHASGFDIQDPTHILVSCIWEKNKESLIDGHKWFHPHAEIIAGGPGYDPSVTMIPEIEMMKPDYSLYPDFNDSIGYVTMGCFRRCPFCVVPAMKPLHYVQHVKEFYQGGECRILDDNILAMPEKFKETAQWLIDHGVKTRFEYLDIRLVTEEIAEFLSQIKRNGRPFYFAYDIRDPRIEPLIERNIRILREKGIGKRAIGFLIYIHSKNETDLVDAMERWRFIRSCGAEVFGMPNNENIHDYKLKKRVTRPAIWRGMTPEEVFGLA